MKTLYFFLLFTTIDFSQAVRDFFIVGNTVECVQRSPFYVHSFGCHIKQIGNRTIGNIQLQLNRPVPTLSARVILDMYRAGMGRLNLFDLRLDAYKFLETIQTKRVFAVFGRNLLRFMNVVPKCPLKANFNYTLTDFFYDENDLPTYTPEASYRNVFYFSLMEKAEQYMAYFAVNYNMYNLC